MKDGADSVTSSELGEPLTDVFFYDVVENGDSAFVGCELLAKDRDAYCHMPCPNFGENVIEVTTLV